MLDFEFDRPKYRVIAIGPMYDDEDYPEERFDKKLEHLLNCGDDAGNWASTPQHDYRYQIECVWLMASVVMKVRGLGYFF